MIMTIGTTPTTYNHYTPYELVFGKPAHLTRVLEHTPVQPVYNLDDYYRKVKFRLQVTHERAKTCLDETKSQRKRTYDAHTVTRSFQANDLILLSNETRHKLDSWFTAPCTVVSSDKVNYVKLLQFIKTDLSYFIPM